MAQPTFHCTIATAAGVGLMSLAVVTPALGPLALAGALPLRDPGRGLIGTVTLASIPDTPGAAGAVRPVASVDLQRYGGRWYEIARIPAWFQSSCVRDTTATYQLRDDGRITVINECLRRNGTIDRARGVARSIDPSTNARLQVSFVSFLGWRPFWGDYWILGLDPDYRWAVVGDPSRRFGWILARTPGLEPATLDATFAVFERNGYQRDRFVLTPQGH